MDAFPQDESAKNKPSQDKLVRSHKTICKNPRQENYSEGTSGSQIFSEKIPQKKSQEISQKRILQEQIFSEGFSQTFSEEIPQKKSLRSSKQILQKQIFQKQTSSQGTSQSQISSEGTSQFQISSEGTSPSQNSSEEISQSQISEEIPNFSRNLSTSTLISLENEPSENKSAQNRNNEVDIIYNVYRCPTCEIRLNNMYVFLLHILLLDHGTH